MQVDEALIAAMEKIRDAMLDFEVAADKGGMGEQHDAQAPDVPHETPEPMEGSPEEEAMEPAADEAEEDKPAFTSLGSHRFGAGSPRVDLKSNKMPVGKRRY